MRFQQQTECAKLLRARPTVNIKARHSEARI